MLAAASVWSSDLEYFGAGVDQGPPPGGPPRDMDMRMYAQLDLTSAQREQIRALRVQERTESETYMEQLMQARESMRAAVEADVFDEAAARAAAVLEGQATTELSVIRARTEAAVYKLLTAEQRAKLAELRQQRRPPAP